jgi:hypothetical protein
MNSKQLGLFMAAVLLAAGATAVGCGDDESTGGTTSGTTSGSTTTSATTGTTSSTTTTTTTSASSGGGQGGSGQGGAGQGGSGQGGASPLTCDPDPGDTACITCLKTNCCNEIEDCAADPNCTACVNCAQTMDPIMCVGNGTCNLQDPTQSAILQCGQANCSTDCQM